MNPIEQAIEALEDQIRATAHAMGMRPDIIAMRGGDVLASQYASPSAIKALARLRACEVMDGALSGQVLTGPGRVRKLTVTSEPSHEQCRTLNDLSTRLPATLIVEPKL